MSEVRVIQTTKDSSDRLAEKDALIPGEKQEDAIVIGINPNKKFQTILGFGGALTESAGYTLSKMSGEKRSEIITKYFSPEEGLNYSLGRVHINSCDFSLENYTYVRENDTELKTFDISREKKWVIPLIRDAIKEKNGSIKLLASPWSPPAWMKTNNDMNHGGKLLPEYGDTWAKYYAKYIKAMKAEGIDIWAITVQNEPNATQPWDSCIYSAEEERDFVKNHLGPMLEREKLSDVKLYIWDHNRDILVERADTVLSDHKAAKYVYGVANHWYCSEAFENLSKVHSMYPDKHILFSEGCQEGGTHIGDWSVGERYARNMIGDFNNWQEGWIDWNIVLDENGGPNHVGNFCSAPIIADTITQEIHYNPSYYYIGHFSKYVKPGAIRIEVNSSEPSNLKYTGFINETGSCVLIVMNDMDNSERANIELGGKYIACDFPAHSITTCIF